MTENEIYEKLRESAEDVIIPESLTPEEIKKKCKAEGKLSARTPIRAMAAAAAAIAVCCGAAYGLHFNSIGNAGALEVAEEESGTEETDTAGAAAASDAEVSYDKTSYVKKDAGELYVVAKDYGEVYDAIAVSYDNSGRTIVEAADGIEGAASASGSEIVGIADSVATMGSSLKSSHTYIKYEAADDEDASYSKTNVQTEGVDESDIVKTDGRYIYVVSGSSIDIISAADGRMKKVSEIDISMNSATDYVQEIYVDGDRLSVIVEKVESDLTPDDGETYDDIAYYKVDYKNVTELVTYDISDRNSPKMSGAVSQDGSYYDSRKIGDIVYLFTEKRVTDPGYARETAILDDNISGWIPVVNDEAVSACDIYLQDGANNGLLITSVDIKNPDAVVDDTLIINNYANIYVSKSSIYLYNNDYQADKYISPIAKFRLEDGRIGAVGAVTVPGWIKDTFAITEQDGALMVLTTDSSGGSSENGLYLYDENLSLTGKLDGIAPGEQIYAARYIGDVAYFVTYRNTDPLFAVDISDKTDPVMLGEVKITGFSEYLHAWSADGESLLLGLGYEINENTGEYEGVKLVMFDISDPSNPVIKATSVMKDTYYSPAMYNYKAVLADADAGIIGFAAIGDDMEYLVYSWENGGFAKKLEVELEGFEGGLNADDCRGLYIGDYFYLASKKGVSSYAINDSYKLVDELSL